MKKTLFNSIIILNIFTVLLLIACGSGGGGGDSENSSIPTEENDILWTTAEGGYRVSGNGYYYPDPNTDNMLSGGMNVTSTTLEGWLIYYYPNMNLRSTKITGVLVEVSDKGYRATITGEGTMELNPGYTFKAIIYATPPDYLMALTVFNPDGSLHFQAELQKIGMKGYFTISAL